MIGQLSCFWRQSCAAQQALVNKVDIVEDFLGHPARHFPNKTVFLILSHRATALLAYGAFCYLAFVYVCLRKAGC